MGTSAIGGMNIVLSANAASFSAGIAQAQAQLNRLAGAAKTAGHSTVSSMQAASASIRVLEGGMTGNIRAAERFISLIPGVGKALQAAFPLVGAIALAGVFVKIGGEVVKFIETVNKMPTAIQNGFRTLNLSAQSSNDALAVTNDKLANEIAKLEGKPQNNLKLEIDETRVAADKLASALDSDNQRVAELLQRNHISAFGGFIGSMGTAGTEGAINSYNQKFADIGAQRNIAVHQGDTAAVAQFGKALADAQNSALAWAAQRIQGLQKDTSGLNTQANINDVQSFATVVRTAQDRQSGEATNAQLEAQKARLDAARELAEAQKRLLEQQKQAQEQIVAQWRKDLDQARADNDMTLAQEGQFWVQRIEASRKGSLSYIAAMDEANKIIARMRQENMRGQAGFDETSAKSYMPSAMNQGDHGDQGAERTGGREAVDYLKSLNEQISMQKQADNAYSDAALHLAAATGQMSKLDEATAMAALHTREYGDYLDSVKAALASIAADPALSALQKAQASAGINAGAAQAAGQRNIQVLQDQQGIAGQQLGPAISQAFAGMVNEWGNMTQAVVSVMTRAADSLNDDIVKAMTGQGKKGDFGKTLMQGGQGLLKASLQKGESALFGGLFGKGGGQLGSSSNNPMWVQIAGSAAAPAGGGGSAPGGLLGGILGKFIQPFIQGHFAAGGDVLAGYPAMVGERGPEMFIPHTAGTIVPNHQLGGSGGTNHYYSIDARGATDPAAIHAAVARALPHAVAASMQAQHQFNMRRPQGR